jgi:GDPmannose 4,6-dehydratase
VQGLVSVQRGESQTIQLGNLDDVKDWGFAGDYAKGMWLMAQADSPSDYILATGIGHTVEDFVQKTADLLELRNWREVVTVQQGVTRPVTKTRLVGNPQAAKLALGWNHSLDFPGLVELIVRHAQSDVLD